MDLSEALGGLVENNGLEELVKLVQGVDPIIESIKQREGFDATIRDDNGNPTVGHGFNLNNELVRNALPEDVASGKRAITLEEADDVINEIYPMAEEDARKFVSNFDDLTPDQQAGLIDMSYNLGLPTLNKFKGLRTALESGNSRLAALEVLDSNYATQTGGRAIENANRMAGQPVDIEALQKRLGVTVDGKFGPQTRNALRQQRGF